jgi:hypothetical protein
MLRDFFGEIGAMTVTMPRDRLFVSAAESPRRYSEIRMERIGMAPAALQRIEALEAEARAATGDERAKLQGEAEELRDALYHDGQRKR